MGWQTPTPKPPPPVATPIRVRKHETDYEVIDGDTVLFTTPNPIHAIAIAHALRDGTMIKPNTDADSPS